MRIMRIIGQDKNLRVSSFSILSSLCVIVIWKIYCVHIIMLFYLNVFENRIQVYCYIF